MQITNGTSPNSANPSSSSAFFAGSWRQWKALVTDFSGSPKLWLRYLDFTQTEAFLSVTYGDTLQAFLDYLEVLRATRARLPSTSRDQHELYETQIYVVLRMTLFCQEAGFKEYALATWQALLELEFFEPFGNGNGEQGDLTKFEKFWDSEVPRLGEEGARGWHLSDTEDVFPSLGARVGSLSSRSACESDAFARWASSERESSWKSQGVARTVDDETDPYRVVLYSDIEASLFTSPTKERREILVDAFLVFCHRPPFRLHSSFNNNVWWAVGLADNPGALQLSEDHKGRSLLDSYQPTQDVLFATQEEWCSAFHMAADGNSDLNPLTAKWILTVMKALITAHVVPDDLSQYCLAYELTVSPSTVLESAKNMLRRCPSSVRLYNAYALLQHRLGNRSKLEKVIIATLTKQLDPTMHQDWIFLWCRLLWDFIDAGRYADALASLLSFPKPTAPQAVAGEGRSEAVESITLLRAEKVCNTADQCLTSCCPRFQIFPLCTATFVITIHKHMQVTRDVQIHKSKTRPRTISLYTPYEGRFGQRSMVHSSLAAIFWAWERDG